MNFSDPEKFEPYIERRQTYPREYVQTGSKHELVYKSREEIKNSSISQKGKMNTLVRVYIEAEVKPGTEVSSSAHLL